MSETPSTVTSLDQHRVRPTDTSTTQPDATVTPMVGGGGDNLHPPPRTNPQRSGTPSGSSFGQALLIIVLTAMFGWLAGLSYVFHQESKEMHALIDKNQQDITKQISDVHLDLRTLISDFEVQNAKDFGELRAKILESQAASSKSRSD